jgi:hypothetical protein
LSTIRYFMAFVGPCFERVMVIVYCLHQLHDEVCHASTLIIGSYIGSYIGSCIGCVWYWCTWAGRVHAVCTLWRLAVLSVCVFAAMTVLVCWFWFLGWCLEPSLIDWYQFVCWLL